MSLVESLSKAQIFSDLAPAELEKVAALGHERSFGRGDTILGEGDRTRELFIIARGMVEVSLATAGTSTPLVNLGTGQIFGEMSLVDRGARSATVKAVSDDTLLQVIPHQALLELCQQDNHIGFIVMRNLAAEMSLRLRYHNIARSMNASE
jgi:CRP/FNR family cyclic AMP-dependent transcriptional regulator